MKAYILAAALCLLGCKQDDSDSASFPAIDHKDLLITLERSGCYGSCPAYKLTIAGDGRVVFESRAQSGNVTSMRPSTAPPEGGVLVPGRHEVRVAPSTIDALIDRFRRAQFFSLKDQYRAQVTDSPTVVLSIDTGHGRKRVLDYVGEEAGMPASVSELEDAVDAAANTGRWVKGSKGLIAWLAATGFDFHSPQAARILLTGVNDAADETLTDLVKRGAPLDEMVSEPFSRRGPPRTEPVGVIAIEAAIRSGRAPLFQLLAQRGWLSHLGRDRAGQAFAERGASCSLPMLEAYLAAGLPIDAASAGDPLDYETGRSALGMMASDTFCDYDPARQHAMVEALLERGANPNHEDAAGETPMFGADLETAKMLLAHGADVSHRNHEGETPIFGADMPKLDLLISHGADPRAKDKHGRSALLSSFKDEVAMRLLEAGADPRGTREDGRSLRVIGTRNHMKRTLAWLDARQIP